MESEAGAARRSAAMSDEGIECLLVGMVQQAGERAVAVDRARTISPLFLPRTSRLPARRPHSGGHLFPPPSPREIRHPRPHGRSPILTAERSPPVRLAWKPP